ncbi:hypothetical protein OAQ45_00305 [Candidatus Marinimicrobia bacterium]|nr:hypothetical protein [Candidatus Neomarinimicrobiota bacterium]
MSFVPIFWNTETQQNLENKTSKIYGSHIAYKKQGYDWTSVSNDVQTDLSVSAFAGNVQFPTTAQGWMDICFNSEYSAKRQITEGNWSNTEDEFNMRMRTDTPTNSVGIIHPDKPWQVIYYNAFGQGANLIYGVWRGKQCRAEHVIEITEMPAGDSEYLTYDFYVESTNATTFIGGDYNERPWDGNVGDSTTVDGFSVFIAKGDDFNTPRGSVLRTPACWWTNLDGTFTKKDVKIDFEIQPDGITVKATKYVKRSDIAEALAQGSVYRADATFSPDAHPESTSVDGYIGVQSQNKSWNDLIGLSTGSASSYTTSVRMAQVRDDAIEDQWDDLYRGFMLFDTSSIGSDRIVDSASLTLYRTITAAQDYSVSWNLYSSNPVTNTEIVGGDFDSLGSIPFMVSGESLSVADSHTSTEYALNSAGRNHIEIQGITKFGTALQEDRENAIFGDPTWVTPSHLLGGGAQYVDCTSAENPTVQPVLTVIHSTGTPLPPALILKDRVKETTTTSGKGGVNLQGASAGFESFVSAVGDANECYYTIVDANGTDWEVGFGVVGDDSTDTLSRQTILESSNNDSGVSLSESGAHTVFLTYPADKAVYRDVNDQIVATASGILFSDDSVQTTAASASVTYTAGTGLLLSGTEFDVSGVDTSLLQGTISTAQIGDDQVTAAKVAADVATQAELDTVSTVANAALPKTGGAMAGAITTNSTFDGRDVATDGTKLDGIEASATADQTQADINALEITKVGTIATGVWQGTAIAHAYIGADAIDGDNIADDSVDSEHYVDGSIDTAHIGDDQVTVDKLANSINTAIDANTAKNTNVSTNLSATANGTSLTVESSDGTNVALPAATTSAWGVMSDDQATKLDGIEASADVTDATNVTAAGALMDSELTDLAGVKGVTISTLQVKPTEGAFANGDKTKLDAIEASADVTDTTNVTSAGALMDSELADLAGVKGVTISTLQVKPSEGAFVDGDKTKLDAIEASATADQTKSDIDGLAITTVGTIDTGTWQGTQIATAYIADNAVTLAKLAGGTDGQIITFDANGDPVAVGPGTDGQVLTSTGSGSPPAFEDASGGGAVSAVANGSDNRVVTFSSSDALNGEANLTFDGSALGLVGTFTVGADDTGHDVKFHGATAGSYLEWDESEDRLNLVGGAYVNEAVPASDTPTTEDATVTLDLSLGSYHNIVLGANVTKFEFTNAKRGQKFILRITQHASSAKTVGWTNVDSDTGGTAANLKWAGNITPTMSTTVSHKDVYGFICTSGTAGFDGFIIGQDIPD